MKPSTAVYLVVGDVSVWRGKERRGIFLLGQQQVFFLYIKETD